MDVFATLHDLVHGPTFVYGFVTEGTFTIANPPFTFYCVFTLATADVKMSGLNWTLYWRTISPPFATLRHYKRRWQSMYFSKHVCRISRSLSYPPPHTPHHSTPHLLLPNGEEWPQRIGLIPRTPSLGMSVLIIICAYIHVLLEKRLDHTHLFTIDSKWHHPAWYHLVPLWFVMKDGAPILLGWVQRRCLDSL